LHGLPSSSRMFEPLFARLSDRYHLVAPDYPGFGHSAWPDPKKFAYTFDHCAEIMNTSPNRLGSRDIRFICRITAAPWVFAWPWPIPTGSKPSSFTDAVVHNVLDAGHFAFDTAADQIAQIVRGFMRVAGANDAAINVDTSQPINRTEEIHR
jgi:pimeloyl-ACP methyl ester carboxylesterase